MVVEFLKDSYWNRISIDGFTYYLLNCQIMKIILAKLDLCLSCGYNTIFIYGTFIIIFHLRKLILRESDLADLGRKLLHKNLLTIIFFWTKTTSLKFTKWMTWQLVSYANLTTILYVIHISQENFSITIEHTMGSKSTQNQ